MNLHTPQAMKTRVVQHNIRIVAGYYQRIQGKRLAELLGLSSEDLEKHMSNMVSDGDIYAKIDRPNDLIRFAKQKSSEEVRKREKGVRYEHLAVPTTTQNSLTPISSSLPRRPNPTDPQRLGQRHH